MKNINDVLNEMDDDELLSVFREACWNTGDFDFADIYDFEELADTYDSAYEYV